MSLEILSSSTPALVQNLGSVAQTSVDHMCFRKVLSACVTVLLSAQSVNPYIVKLSIVDDEPTLDVSMLSFRWNSGLCLHMRHETLGFSPQGMGMVVHQALTEYNR